VKQEEAAAGTAPRSKEILKHRSPRFPDVTIKLSKGRTQVSRSRQPSTKYQTRGEVDFYILRACPPVLIKVVLLGKQISHEARSKDSCRLTLQVPLACIHHVITRLAETRCQLEIDLLKRLTVGKHPISDIDL
jgi:hypothetical protein